MSNITLYQCKKCKTITSEERVLCKECHSLEPFDVITPFDLISPNQLDILNKMVLETTKADLKLQHSKDVVALFVSIQKAMRNKKNVTIKEEQ